MLYNIYFLKVISKPPTPYIPLFLEIE